MKYELLLFDADGTLFDFEKCEADALYATLNSFDISSSGEDLLALFKQVNTRIWEEFENKLISAGELKIERFRRYFSMINVNADPGKFSNRYLYNLSKGTDLLPEAYSLLQKIHSLFKIVIITNGLTSVQKPRFENSAIFPFVDKYVISEEFGVPKPNKEIFEHALEIVDHMEKSTTLMIGDKLSSDIKGGHDFGVDTCWYNPLLLDNSSEINPEFEIHSLSELEQIIL
jgi:YjjG family noncanonical pyrimidine nucleotidase